MTPRQLWLNRLVFGTETPAGRWFDLVVIGCIIASVAAALLDSMPQFHERHHEVFYLLEWTFTLLFTIEYGLRLYSSEPPRRSYALSFFGLVDLCAILPAYLALLVPGASYLLVLRLLRVLRIFRILKLVRYVGDANILVRALVLSRHKILVFLFSVLVLNIVFGSLMYVIEGAEHGFTSIPVSIYWSIVTMTTVGYGDISPKTDLGRLLASIAMITGYAIIAVPTGIISSELIQQAQGGQDKSPAQRQCPSCSLARHDHDARFCKQCGTALG